MAHYGFTSLFLLLFWLSVFSQALICVSSQCLDINPSLRHESRNKGMKHSWKNLPPMVGIKPGPPGYKSNALTTEPKSRLPDAVVRDWIYT